MTASSQATESLTAHGTRHSVPVLRMRTVPARSARAGAPRSAPGPCRAARALRAEPVPVDGEYVGERVAPSAARALPEIVVVERARAEALDRNRSVRVEVLERRFELARAAARVELAKARESADNYMTQTGVLLQESSQHVQEIDNAQRRLHANLWELSSCAADKPWGRVGKGVSVPPEIRARHDDRG